MTTLFENDNYIVRVSHGDDRATKIVVSFTGIGAPERHDTTFFGQPLAMKLQIPWVGLIAKHDGWYRDGDYQQAFAVAASWIRERRRALGATGVEIIGYGVSMGAYAAIRYSRFFAFDYVFAMAPQWSLDREQVSHHSHFQALFQPFMKGMGIRADDVQGTINVFYDPYEKPDAEELRMIRENFPAQAIPVCRAGHSVTEHLKGTALFQQFIEHRAEPAILRRIASRARRIHNDHVTRVVMQGHHRHPLLTYRFLRGVERQKPDAIQHLFEHERNVLGSLGRLLVCAKGGADAARWIFTRLHGLHRSFCLLPYLMAWNGELLCFDSGVYRLSEGHTKPRGLPVILLEDSLFAATPAGLVPVPGIVEEDGVRFSIRLDGQFLSSRPDGSTSLAAECRDWEKYCRYSPG